MTEPLHILVGEDSDWRITILTDGMLRLDRRGASDAILIEPATPRDALDLIAAATEVAQWQRHNQIPVMHLVPAGGTETQTEERG